jgi:hypothetical protein
MFLPSPQRSFDEHNLEQTIWHVERPGGDYQHSLEAFSLWDFDSSERIKRTKEHAKKETKEIPVNMLGSQLLCYRCACLSTRTATGSDLSYLSSNVWDIKHAGGHSAGIPWYEGFQGQQREEGLQKEMTSIAARGSHPGSSSLFRSSSTFKAHPISKSPPAEWWALGQYMDVRLLPFLPS